MGAPPLRLVDVPAAARIDETFGWFPASVVVAGVLGVIGAVITAIQEGGFDLPMLQLTGGAIVAIFVFGFWEFWRRKRRTSVVLSPDRRLAIYRKGQLAGVATFDQVTHFRLSPINTLRECMLFGVVGVGGILTGLASIAGPKPSLAVWTLAGGVGGCMALISTVWSRVMCSHYYIPKGNHTETVVLRRSDLSRVGWPMT
ncbi:hypothetical protein AKJ09_02125 [Labilithrix luteola]|uniref:Uncharacterized protein n=2 Tax=Labilithrix luteola TaxID=1391654 RepID=A0A0K1PQ03_9BACT|nr:hypothetical protein AKJ09_02125 [Labilithrix luteola]